MEPTHKVRIIRKSIRQHFDSDMLIVLFLITEEHRPHPAFAELAQESKSAQSSEMVTRTCRRDKRSAGGLGRQDRLLIRISGSGRGLAFERGNEVGVLQVESKQFGLRPGE